MGKRRKSPTILKPVIDEEAALRFASAGSAQASEPSTAALPEAVPKHPAAKKSPPDSVEKDMRRILLTISNDLYDKIAKEAARKNRTVEEHIQKRLTKRYEK